MWTKNAELKEKAVRPISSDNEIDMTSFARVSLELVTH